MGPHLPITRVLLRLASPTEQLRNLVTVVGADRQEWVGVSWETTEWSGVPEGWVGEWDDPTIRGWTCWDLLTRGFTPSGTSTESQHCPDPSRNSWLRRDVFHSSAGSDGSFGRRSRS